MKKRYKEAYKKAFILEIKKSTSYTNIVFDCSVRGNAIQKALLFCSKQQISEILCENFGISWKPLIQFQLSHNYFYFSCLWAGVSFIDLLERIKQDVEKERYLPTYYALSSREFEFISSLI